MPRASARRCADANKRGGIWTMVGTNIMGNIVDIDQDEALLRRYMFDVPAAVRPDGTELARHRLEPGT